MAEVKRKFLGTKRDKSKQLRSSQEKSKVAVYSFMPYCYLCIYLHHLLLPFVPWGNEHKENKQIKLERATTEWPKQGSMVRQTASPSFQGTVSILP